MTELAPDVHPVSPLLKELGISHIGTLVLLGQGPVQDSATKVKLENIAGGEGEANTWMRMIARAGAALYKTGEVETIIPSGRATGGIGPTEADLMETIVRNLTKQGEKPAEIIKEPEARNTLYNFINTANIIDERGLGPDVTIVCAHFHKPRIKVLASIFGFDPHRVVSAEEILTASSNLALQGPRGEHFDPKGFDRQASMLTLLRIRLGDDHAYFDRKQARALKNLRDIAPPGVTNGLFIEEQKSAMDRMKDERRWVRGLAMEPDYVVPLLGQLKNEKRLQKALLHFPGVDRTSLDPAKWSWQVVKEAWRDEQYPQEVLDRLQALGISEDDRNRLSQARLPEIQFVGTSI